MDIKTYEEEYEKVAKALGWAVDKRIAMAVNSFYLIQNHPFQESEHEQTSKIIKKTEGWASPLKSHMHHIVAAFLTVREDDAETGLKKLNMNQQGLNDAGFSKSPYTYLAALLMGEPEEAMRAKALYDQMKEHHKFLTSNEDVPYAVLLGRQAGDPVERAATMNAYYKDLREQGFYMGNDLQWLSQIMTFSNPVYDPKVVGRVLAVHEFFKEQGIKIRTPQYPILGLLAVAEADGKVLQEIADKTNVFEKSKTFKWYKDNAFSTVVQFELKDFIETRDVSAVTFATSLEMLMQAQQAAMMTSINAAIISSTNSSSS